MEPTHQLISASAAMREIGQEVLYAARTDAKVLISGESGVGKEVVARLIHQRSRRSHSPLVTINCAGVPDSLLESELFGHVRGSFTDAHRDKRGWFEQAHGGTIFMDEVGEMSMRMQALLLRFLENGEIQRVGCDRVSSMVDVRVIAATNKNLLEHTANKTFREDLGPPPECHSSGHTGAARAAGRHSASLRSFSPSLWEAPSHRATDSARRNDGQTRRLRLAGQCP